MGPALSITDDSQAWMLAFQAGDRERFGMLVELHRQALVRYLYRTVENRAVAEELAQEVFLRVYLSRNYRPAAKFRTWLFHIATNLALNWLRDHKAESAVLPLEGRPRHLRRREAAAAGRSAEERLIEEARLDEVRKAIGELPERSRAAVLMHKYEEMEYTQIAAVLRCSVAATKSLLFRAYEHLRARLAHLERAA